MTNPTKTPAKALARLRALAVVSAVQGREDDADELRDIHATLARAVENDARFRWMQANCYSNEHRDRDWPHVVIADVCIGTIPGDKTGHYNVGPEARVGIAALDFAIDAARGVADQEKAP